jgi:hypothetical protein
MSGGVGGLRGAIPVTRPERGFYDFNFLIGQAVQFIDQIINLFVCRGDLAFVGEFRISVSFDS